MLKKIFKFSILKIRKNSILFCVSIYRIILIFSIITLFLLTLIFRELKSEFYANLVCGVAVILIDLNNAIIDWNDESKGQNNIEEWIKKSNDQKSVEKQVDKSENQNNFEE